MEIKNEKKNEKDRKQTIGIYIYLHRTHGSRKEFATFPHYHGEANDNTACDLCCFARTLYTWKWCVWCASVVRTSCCATSMKDMPAKAIELERERSGKFTFVVAAYTSFDAVLSRLPIDSEAHAFYLSPWPHTVPAYVRLYSLNSSPWSLLLVELSLNY